MPLPEVFVWWNRRDLPTGTTWDWTTDTPDASGNVVGLSGDKRPPSAVPVLRCIQADLRGRWESPLYPYRNQHANFGRWMPRLQTNPSYRIERDQTWGPTGDVPLAWGGRDGAQTAGQWYTGPWADLNQGWPGVFDQMTEPPPKLWPTGFQFDEDDDEHIEVALTAGRYAAEWYIQQGETLYGTNTEDWVILIKSAADDDDESVLDTRWRDYWKWCWHSYAETLGAYLDGRRIRAMQFHIEARRVKPEPADGTPEEVYGARGGFPPHPDGQWTEWGWSRVRRDFWIRRLCVNKMREQGIRSIKPWGGYGTNYMPRTSWYAKGASSYAAPDETIPIIESWIEPNKPSIPWIAGAGFLHTNSDPPFLNDRESVRALYGAAIDNGCDAVVVWLDRAQEDATDIGETFHGMRMALSDRGIDPDTPQ